MTTAQQAGDPPESGLPSSVQDHRGRDDPATTDQVLPANRPGARTLHTIFSRGST
jgi:hypothetical protein